MGSIKSTKSRKGRVEVDSNGKDEIDGRNELNISDNEIGDNEIVEKENHWKIPKSKKTISFLDFFIPKARLKFIKLR